MHNEILMRRHNKMIVPQDDGEPCSEKYLASVLKNMEAYGYTVSSEVYSLLKELSYDGLVGFYTEFTGIAEKLSGGNLINTPMYPNFPKEVMEVDEAELYVNALVHYLTLGKLLPNIKEDKRLPLFDETTVKVISAATEDDITSIMRNIMRSSTSISQTDKDDLAWFFSGCDSAAKYIPEQIPMKENAAYICALYLRYAAPFNLDRRIIYRHIKTATDVLRLAVAMSDGDVSLTENTRFKSIKRVYRRLFLSILNRVPNLEEDMKRYREQWIRLGEVLHPGDYDKYPKALKVFNKLREDEDIATFGGQLNKHFMDGNYKAAVSMLKCRPGEFARKLDFLLRSSDDPIYVANEFEKVAKDVATPVLWQVKNHFENRNTDNLYRVFFPKGNVAKSKIIPNELLDIPDKVCRRIVNICEAALILNYSKRDVLGFVYLDDSFKNYCVPFSQRSASNAMRTVTRGSKFPLGDSKSTIRAFIHWKNMPGYKESDGEYSDERVDNDLSAILYDENWNYMEHISYTHLRSEKYKSCHSGDITNAPDGASEFIDVDIDSVKKCGGRYIVFSVYNYTEQCFKDVPNCYMGWMEREEPDSGEIFEESTVKNRIDLTASSRISIPMIVDAVERKVIWADMSLKNHPNYNVNLESNQGGIVASCMAITQMNKPTLYDLVLMNIRTRGFMVTNPAKADIVFCEEIPKNQDENKKYITPFMMDTFMGEYL